MIRFFLESTVVYAVARVGVRLHLWSWADLREFGVFVLMMGLFLLASRFSALVRDRLHPERRLEEE